MSLLQKQLNQIKVEHKALVGSSLNANLKASLLFSAKEAADYDLDAIFCIGQNGIQELVAMSPHFARYEKTIFSESFKSYDRVLKTKQDNDTLDKELNSFFKLLSQYFLLKPSFKVLEYLIRRFKVQEFNVESLILMMLPYHETEQFVKLLSVLALEENARWNHLLPFQAKKSTLTRTYLCKVCASDPYVMEVIFNYINTESAMNIYVSFFTCLIVETLPLLKSEDCNALNNLVHITLNGLKNKKNVSLQIGTLMILNQLSGKFPLSLDFINSICCILAQQYEELESIQNQATLTIVQLVQNGMTVLEEFPDKCFKFVMKLGSFMNHVERIAQDYNITRFLKLFYEKLIACAFSNVNYMRQADNWMNSDLFNHVEKGNLMSLFIKAFNFKEDYSSHVKNIICAFEKYEIFDSILVEIIKTNTIAPELLPLLSSNRYYFDKDLNSVLFLSLNDHSSSSRLMALNRVNEILNSNEDFALLKEDCFADSILGLLQDSNSEVKMKAWSLPLSRILNANDVAAVAEKESSDKSLRQIIFDRLVEFPFNERILLLVLTMKKKDSKLPQQYTFKNTEDACASFNDKEELLIENFEMEASRNIFLALFNKSSEDKQVVLFNKFLDRTVRTESDAHVFMTLITTLKSAKDVNFQTVGTFDSPTGQLLKRCYLSIFKFQMKRPQDYIQALIKHHLISNFVTFMFGMSYSIEDGLDENCINAITLNNLIIVKAFLSSAQKYDFQIVLANLLVLLMKGSDEIKLMSMECVKHLYNAGKEVYMKNLYNGIQWMEPKANSLKHMVDVLVENEKSVLCDASFFTHNYLNLVFAKTSKVKSTIFNWFSSLALFNYNYFADSLLGMCSGVSSSLKSVAFLPLLSKLSTDQASMVVLDSYKTSTFSNETFAAVIELLSKANIDILNMYFDKDFPSNMLGNLSGEKGKVFFEALVTLLFRFTSLKSKFKEIDVPEELFAAYFAEKYCEKSNGNGKKSKEAKNLNSLEDFVILLELLQTKVNGYGALMLNTLFKCMKYALTLQTETDEGFNFDYLYQMVLVNLNSLITEKSSSEDLRVDLLMQVMRTSSNPQTHQQILITLALIARINPDVILHSLMPIFTFMGTNTLRMDDEYSQFVVQKTIQTILPIVKEKSDVNVEEYIRVFVDSFNHIPKHRRLVVYRSLVETTESLPMVWRIIVEKITESSILMKDDDVFKGSFDEFLLELILAFPMVEQVKSFKEMIESEFQIRTKVHEAYETDLIRKYKSIVLLQLRGITSSSQFTVQFKDADSSMEELIEFIMTLMKIVENGAEGAACQEVLNNLSYLISIPKFVEVVETLLNCEDASVKKRAVKYLNKRLDMFSMTMMRKNNEAFGKLVSVLNELLKKKASGIYSEIVYSVTILSRCFAKEFPEVYLGIAGLLLVEENLQVDKMQSLVCLGSICMEVGPKFIPYLSKYAKLLIEAFEDEISSKECLSLLAALLVLVCELPKFLSPYVSSIAKLVIEECDFKPKDQLEAMGRKDVIMEKLATNVESRIILFSLIEIAKENVVNSRFYVLLRKVIAEMDKTAFAAYYLYVFKLILTLMENYEGDEVSMEFKEMQVEFILKMNDGMFKPLFIKLQDWCGDDDEHKLFMMYSWINALFDKLKALFTPYFHLIYEHCVKALQFGGTVHDVALEGIYKSLLYSETYKDEKLEDLIEILAEEIRSENMSELLCQTLGQIAVVANSDTIWKPLNSKVMQKTRDEDPQVRIFAIQVMHEFYKKLGEEFLILLPETIPFLAELMEDEEPEVEKACQELVQTIEQHLGEPLKKYFGK
jgi:hypothetical protein